MIIDKIQCEIKEIVGCKVVREYNLMSIVNNNGECEGEIRRRLILARTATVKLTNIWNN